MSRKPEPKHRLEIEGIGTLWQLLFFEQLPQKKIGRISEAVKARIDQFDRNYSRFRDDSLVTEMSRSDKVFTLPADAEPMFDLYTDMELLSGGLVTPLIGRTLEEAGYDPEYSLKPKKMTMPPRWEDAVEYNFPQIRLKQPALIDVGAAGKGYLVDLIVELIHEHGVNSFVIDAGGDLYYSPPLDKPMPVGLEDPSAAEESVGILSLPPQTSVCGSAGNRRRWDRFTHIINPKTLRSPSEIEATWVLAESGLLADMLATALFFVPYQRLRKQYNFEYAMLYTGHSLSHSRNFPARFFTPQEVT